MLIACISVTRQKLTRIGNATIDGRRSGGQRTGKYGPRSNALAAFKVSVTGADAQLATCNSIAIHAETHRTTRLAPLCARIEEYLIQAKRLRDGSRRITHITEVLGMEGDVIITQDIFVYDITGEDENGKLIGKHKSTGVGNPKMMERARYYGEEERLQRALDDSEDRGSDPF